MERKRKKKKNNGNASSDEENSAPRPQRQRRNHPAGQGHFVFEDAPFYMGYTCRWCTAMFLSRTKMLDHLEEAHSERNSYWRSRYAWPAYKTLIINRATGERVPKDRIPQDWLPYMNEQTRKLIHQNPNLKKGPKRQATQATARQAPSRSASSKRKAASPPPAPVGKRFTMEEVGQENGQPIFRMVTIGSPEWNSGATSSPPRPTAQHSPRPIQRSPRPVQSPGPSYASVAQGDAVFASRDVRYFPPQQPAQEPPRAQRPRVIPAASAGSVLQVARDAVNVSTPLTPRTPANGSNSNRYVAGATPYRRQVNPRSQAPKKASGQGRHPTKQAGTASAPKPEENGPKESKRSTAPKASNKLKPVTCRNCPRVFSVTELKRNPHTLKEHNQAVHDMKDVAFVCEDCDCHFPTVRLAMDHLHTFHEGMIRDCNNPEVFLRLKVMQYRRLPTCNHCGYTHPDLYNRTLGCRCDHRRRIPEPGKPETTEFEAQFRAPRPRLAYTPVTATAPPPEYVCNAPGTTFNVVTPTRAHSCVDPQLDSQEKAMETVAVAAGRLQLTDKDQDYRQPQEAIPDSDEDSSYEAAIEGLRQAIEGSPMRPRGSRRRKSRSKSKDR